MKRLEIAADVRALLRRFGAIFYTGDPLGEIELMREELRELFQAGLIDRETLRAALEALRRREADLLAERNEER